MSADRVRLRDVALADADLVDSWESPAMWGEFNDFDNPPGPMPRDILANGPLRNDHNGLLLVELVADGTPIGSVGWHKVMYGPNAESAAWNIGISLIPEFRGKGYGTEAQRQVASYLFESRRPTSTGSRPRPTWRTCPSNDRWRRPATSGRGSSAAPSSALAGSAI
jgi:RimJ/RimL family protein N-acetyltransferase